MKATKRQLEDLGHVVLWYEFVLGDPPPKADVIFTEGEALAQHASEVNRIIRLRRLMTKARKG